MEENNIKIVQLTKGMPLSQTAPPFSLIDSFVNLPRHCLFHF